MQKRETLAQLIRRTVFEFEQRQAAQYSPESVLVLGKAVKANQPEPEHKTKRRDCKNITT
jgi:hypothetical protein